MREPAPTRASPLRDVPLRRIRVDARPLRTLGPRRGGSDLDAVVDLGAVGDSRERQVENRVVVVCSAVDVEYGGARSNSRIALFGARGADADAFLLAGDAPSACARTSSVTKFKAEQQLAARGGPGDQDEVVRAA
jgi:hypothetical protein